MNVGFKTFWVLPVVVCALIALTFGVERIFGLSFVDSGIYPRTLSGLKGVLFAPFVHGDWEHLLSNMAALPVLMSMLTIIYRRNYFAVFVSLWVVTGVLVWVLARSSYHIGASGVIYALAFFLFFGGIMSRRFGSMAVSLLVVMLYGGLVWGLSPDQPHVSWESHALGAVAGFVCAFVFVRESAARRLSDKDWDYRFPGFSDADVSSDYSSVRYHWRH